MHSLETRFRDDERNLKVESRNNQQNSLSNFVEQIECNKRYDQVLLESRLKRAQISEIIRDIWSTMIETRSTTKFSKISRIQENLEKIDSDKPENNGNSEKFHDECQLIKKMNDQNNQIYVYRFKQI